MIVGVIAMHVMQTAVMDVVKMGAVLDHFVLFAVVAMSMIIGGYNRCQVMTFRVG